MTAEHALKLIIALEDLTEQTGNQTTHSQNQIIRSLPHEELVRFAVKWKSRRAVLDILSGVKSSGDSDVNATL
jgi:hypothetical protein